MEIWIPLTAVERLTESWIALFNLDGATMQPRATRNGKRGLINRVRLD
jgi:hypothetical protein